MHPDDLGELVRAHEDAVAGRRAISIDHRIVLPAGEQRYVHTRAEVARDGEGRPLRLLGTTQDITERKQAEDALRDSEQRFRQLVESTDVIPWAANAADFRFTYVGPQAVKVLGYPIEDWYGEGIFAPPRHLDDLRGGAAVHQRSTRSHSSAAPTQFEYRMQTSDARTVWIRHIVSVVRAEGKRSSLQGFLFDITERKRAEEQLHLAGEVFQSSGEAIVITDDEMRILSVNPAFCTVTGYEPADAVGQTAVQA